MAIGPPPGMGAGPPPMGPPPGMGGGRGPDLPPMNPGMGGVPGPDIPPQGGDIMAAKQRLMQIAAEAEAILSQFPDLAGELMGGGPEGGVGVMPQMPVAGNTGPPRGLPPGLIA